MISKMPYKDPAAAKARELRRYASRNREIWNKYRRENYLKTRERFHSYKMTLACKECGMTGTSDLHFHHRDPLTKLFNISTRAGSTLSQTVLDEITKCDVLCKFCHRRTFKDINVRRARQLLPKIMNRSHAVDAGDS
jgi:hypothetical protein